MTSKCASFVLSFVALLSSLLVALSVSSSANAWAPLAEPPYTFDIAAKMDDQTASSTYAEMYNWRDRNYAVFEYNNGSNTGTVIMAVWDTVSPRPGSVYDGGSGFTTFETPFICRWSMDGNYLFGCQWGGGFDADHVFNVHLTQEYIDAQNPDTWTPPSEYLGDSGSNPHDPENDNTPRCQPWDIVCWFSSTVDTVVDGFQSLANFFGDTIKALGEWIANLIMPSNAEGGFDNRFVSFFESTNDLLHERLGVLLFPFDFLGQMIGSITSIYNQYGTDRECSNATGTPAWCVIEIPNLLGGNSVGFNIGALESAYPALWDTVIVILRFVWVVGVVAFLHNKYFSVVRS